MCFSAEADLVAGTVVGVIGVAALREVEHPRDLPLASLPLLLAAHQLTEAVVWRSLAGQTSPSSGEVAAWIYLVFAFCLLPVLVPVAVMVVEPELRRKRVMAVCAALGTAVAVMYLEAIVQGPVGAKIDGNHIAYLVSVRNVFVVDSAYVLVACTAWLLSSHRRLVAFGVVNVAAVTTLYWLTETGRTSLWCVWAAVTSVLILVHLRESRGSPAVDGRPAAGAAHLGPPAPLAPRDGSPLAGSRRARSHSGQAGS